MLSKKSPRRNCGIEMRTNRICEIPAETGVASIAERRAFYAGANETADPNRLSARARLAQERQRIPLDFPALILSGVSRRTRMSHDRMACRRRTGGGLPAPRTGKVA